MIQLFTAVGAVLLLVGGLLVRSAARRRGVLAKLYGMVVAALLLALGAAGLGLGLALHAFEAFAGSRVIAQVRCQWVGPKEFELWYAPVVDGRPESARTYRLKGDQWAISGGVVKWHPWLTALGVPSYHRPSRLSGRYADLAQELAHPASAVELSGEPDRLWWWLYQLDPWLPFVDAVYGSAAYTYVNPAMLFEIAVTPSGYLIDRKPLPHEPPRS